MKRKQTGRRFPALVFDAYGTLFDVYSVISLCELSFPERGAALSELWRRKQLEYSWLRSLMGRYQEFWEVTDAALRFSCSTLGLRCDAPTRARLMEAYLHLQPFREVPEVLRALSGYPRAILSNSSPRMLREVVTNAGLAGDLEHLISADEVKKFKPSPEVYRLAPERLGLDAGEILFFSSNAWDAAGAKAYGFSVCWVNRSVAPQEELSLAPDFIVRDLTELPDLLSRTYQSSPQPEV